MENKYFHPYIEDIYVGYELEHLSATGYIETKFEINSSLPALQELIKLNQVRVPYLTKEQIEAEGWEEHSSNFFKKDLLMLQIDLEEYNILIRKGSWFPEETLFKGNCKDINTFRKIIKLLGI